MTHLERYVASEGRRKISVRWFAKDFRCFIRTYTRSEERIARINPEDSFDCPLSVLNLSGGKDNTALAAVMRDTIPEMEYVFCDTGAELAETHEYLKKIEKYLGAETARAIKNAEIAHSYYSLRLHPNSNPWFIAI
jgi:3'-phosphoadenosine 5'-phosphosulfate sulfotransferase (PAPS reductase)/FAD synthetase